MPEVHVEIDGKKYRMACEEGQEAHLQALAERFNTTVAELRNSFGEIGDSRLLVMAGIAVLDSLNECERRVGKLERDIAELTDAGTALASESEALEEKFIRRLAEAARKVDAIATALDEVGATA